MGTSGCGLLEGLCAVLEGLRAVLEGLHAVLVGLCAVVCGGLCVAVLASVHLLWTSNDTCKNTPANHK